MNAIFSLPDPSAYADVVGAVLGRSLVSDADGSLRFCGVTPCHQAVTLRSIDSHRFVVIDVSSDETIEEVEETTAFLLVRSFDLNLN